MTKLYLIRHAEAEGNLYRIAQGQYNSIITDRGYRQIQALSERFRDIPVDAVYSSDLYRACTTAQAICLPKRLPLHRRADLREIGIGDWEEKTWGQIERETPEQLVNFTRHLERWDVPGAEPPAAVRDRMLAALRQIAAKHPGGTSAVFSHGCAIRITLGTIQGYDLAGVGRTPHGDNTAVSLLEADGDELHVVFRDDTTHLSGGLSAVSPEERERRATALQPGLYFRQLHLPEEADWLIACVGSAWADSGDVRPYDRAVLLDEAAARPTLTAISGDTPVGVIQLNPEKEAKTGRGWISLYCMDSAYRAQGLGIQLLGQAVRYYRPLGRTHLRLALARKNKTAARFFSGYGFRGAGVTADGREIWEMDITAPAL